MNASIKLALACCLNPIDNNHIGYNELRAAITEIKKLIKYCDDLTSHKLKIKGFQYIQDQIENLVTYNEKLLGFIRYPEFTDDEISDTIDSAISKYKDRALESGILSCEEGCYFNEYGDYVDDESFKDDNYCQDEAYTDLHEEYKQAHPKGAEIDQTLELLSWECERKIAEIQDYLDFVEKISNVETLNKQKRPNSLVDIIIKDREKVLRVIENELAASNKPQGKLIAMIIIVLSDIGYLPHYKGKVTQIYNAFKKTYPNKVGTIKGIEDYIRGYYRPDNKNPKRIPDDELELLKTKFI